MLIKLKQIEPIQLGVTAADTTQRFLFDKILPEEPLFTLVSDPGGDEKLQLVLRDSGRSSSGELRATANQTNVWDTNGHSDSFRELVGSDFAYVGTSAFAIFDGHSLVYIGIVPRDLIVRVSLSVIPSAAQTSKTCGFGIARKPNGGAYDLAGLQIIGNTQTDACVMAADLPIAAVAITPHLAVTVTRRFSAINQLDAFSVFGAKENGNANLQITGFSMTVELPGLSA